MSVVRDPLTTGHISKVRERDGGLSHLRRLSREAALAGLGLPGAGGSPQTTEDIEMPCWHSAQAEGLGLKQTSKSQRGSVLCGFNGTITDILTTV